MTDPFDPTNIVTDVNDDDDDDEDEDKDFLPPDLAEFIKQHEEDLLAATNDLSNMRDSYLRESENYLDMTRNSFSPPQFPVTKEEEESVLREFQANGENRAAEKEHHLQMDTSVECNLQSDFEHETNDTRQQQQEEEQLQEQDKDEEGDEEGECVKHENEELEFKPDLHSKEAPTPGNTEIEPLSSSISPEQQNRLQQRQHRSTQAALRRKRLDQQLKRIKQRRTSTSPKDVQKTKDPQQNKKNKKEMPKIHAHSTLLQPVSGNTPPRNVDSPGQKNLSSPKLRKISSSSRLLQGPTASVDFKTKEELKPKRVQVVRPISTSSRLLCKPPLQQQQEQPSSKPPRKQTTGNRGSAMKLRTNSRLLQPTKAASFRRQCNMNPPVTPLIRTTVSRHRISLDPNPITRACGSPTHPSTASVCSNVSNQTPRLTIPKTPNFSTAKRMSHRRRIVQGDDDDDQHQASPPFAEKLCKYDQSIMRNGNAVVATTVDKPLTLTIPKGPKFLRNSSSTRSATISSPTFAEVMESYTKSIRNMPVNKYEPKMTVPKAPKFSNIRTRELPKSAAEREEEMMQEIRRRPFRARNAPPRTRQPRSVIQTQPKQQRSVTKPTPFQLSSSRDMSSSLKTTFEKKVGKLSSTQSKSFRARPVPKDTYKPVNNSALKKRPVTVPKAPRLSVSNRNSQQLSPRDEAKENIMTHMKERTKQRLNHVSNGSTRKPFQLRSEERHQVYRERLNQRVREQEEESAKARCFKARAFHASPPPTLQKTKITTTPQPFNLQGIPRHDAYEMDCLKRLKAEEEERQKEIRNRMKANRIPLTHQNPFTPKLPSSKERKIVFHEPNLSVEKRLEQRHEYDESIRKKTMEKIEARLKMEEDEATRECEELSRLRERPACEGGYKFTARPLNRNILLNSSMSSISKSTGVTN